jgi:hypothetical protein
MVPNKSNTRRLPSGEIRFTQVIVTGGDVEEQLSMYSKNNRSVIDSDGEESKIEDLSHAVASRRCRLDLL